MVSIFFRVLGCVMEAEVFLKATAKKLILSKEARKNASRLGEKLLSEGGIEQVIHELLWRETSYE